MVTSSPEQIKMSIEEEKFGELKGRVIAIKETIDRLEIKLFGNGQPGIYQTTLENTVSLEKLISSVAKMADEISTVNKTVGLLAGKIKEIETNTKVSHMIVRYWKEGILIFISLFLILHGIIPEGISLWDWIMHIF